MTGRTGFLGGHTVGLHLYHSPNPQFLSASVPVLTPFIDGYRRGGVGIHIWNVTQEMFNKYQKVLVLIALLERLSQLMCMQFQLVLVAAVIYVLALAFAKLSLIILYHRIISTKPMYKFALYVVTAIVCGYSIAIVFALIFACSPIQKNWDASITRGHCIDRDGLYIATAVTNIITDLALIILPIPVVFTLQMPRIQKLGLLMLFVIGCA